MRRRELYNEDQEPLLDDAQTEKKPQWDLFNNVPRETVSGSTIESKYINLSVKYLKIFTVLITTLVVLGFAVLSKVTLLFMTSQIKPNITRLYCNKNLDQRQQYIVNLPIEERTVWIWTIIFVYMIPEVGTFIRSLRIVSFKRWNYPSKLGFLIVATTEILPVIGSALLVFVVFPEIDVIKGGMLTNGVCLVPAIIAMLSRSSSESRQMVCYILDIVAILVQVSALVMWPIVEEKKILFYTIPPALLLISVGWWENFLSKKASIKWITDFAKSRKDIKKDIYFIYVIVTPLKCLIFLLSAVMIIWIREGEVSFLFDKFGDSFSNHPFKVIQIEPVVGTSGINYTDAIPNIVPIQMETSYWTPITFLLINILSTYICYAFAKFACKIMIQPMSFALPINLTVPVLLTVLVSMCGNYSENECEYGSILPYYLFFNTPTLSRLQEFIGHQYSWIWFIWLLSQTWITIHIWSNDHEKLMSTEQIFRKPMYDAFLIDQSIAMNRRREHDRLIKITDTPGPQEVSDHQITRIYACATMWHETKEEMVEFLKSVFRLDEDQCAHEMVQKYFKIKLQNYYKFETHIFFDDAFIRKSQDDNDPHVNDYVLNLVDTVSEAASKVHAINCKIKPPVVYSTPYGGRLEWTLPGNTKMIAHLKDKAKIRAKKRWSQVMYMYYLLGFGIMDNEEFTPPDVNNRAKNTYILALDGDIDFQPAAVHLLVDYMKKNATLGAACGRIHPVGSGAMAWYQVFEYAVGHWLQKATEHVIGCVLCSPGCFSLFRAGALMDDNVMAKYTTESSEALHYVQFDQGEDRWLCTLLLQRGYRVEYSAASDAYTHCPEGFNEFYNQRRRWMPSTTANIMNLLTDYKHIVAANENISTLYILYQLVIMIGTIIGPGTIFLMLVGAFVAAFKISQYVSLIWNVVPVLLFIIICATCKSDTQLFFAALITGVYGLVMMTVFVGMMIQIEEDGWMAPSSLFLLATLGEFFIAAIMHPQEFYCLKYLVIYYVTVPSMYMLLVIYSIFNMNNVSWGTREVTVVPKPQEEDKAAAAPTAKQAAAPAAKEPSSFLGSSNHNAGSFEFSFGGLFKLLCCTYDSKGEEREVLRGIQASIQQMQQKLDKLEKNKLSSRDSIMEPRKTARATELFVGLKASRASQAMSPLQQSQEYANEDGDADDDVDGDEDNESNFTGSDDIEPNSWYYDGSLVKSRVEFISKRETKFWEKLILKYLYPLDETKKKDVIAKDLKDLRDRMVMTFFMLNALFVLIIYLLNLQQDIIHVNWPINPKVNFTYITDENLVIIQKTYLELQPIGFVFLFMFSALMLVQFIGMTIHRFGTYCQIMANTHIDVSLFRSGKSEDITEQSLLEQDPVKVVKILLRLHGINDDEPQEDDTGIRRDTVHWLALKREKKAKPVIEDLEQAFCKRLSLIHKREYDDKILPRETLSHIRRKTVTMRIKNPEYDGLPLDQERRMSKIIFENPAEDEADG